MAAPKKPKPRAVIYARYSSPSQEPTQDDQLAMCGAVAAARGWTIIENCGDAGRSSKNLSGEDASG